MTLLRPPLARLRKGHASEAKLRELNNNKMNKQKDGGEGA